MSANNINVGQSVKDQLNRCMPAAGKAKLGNVLTDLITQHNALVVKFNALLAKLDADGGVTDTNYAATEGVTATVTDIESR